MNHIFIDVGTQVIIIDESHGLYDAIGTIVKIKNGIIQVRFEVQVTIGGIVTDQRMTFNNYLESFRIEQLQLV